MLHQPIKSYQSAPRPTTTWIHQIRHIMGVTATKAMQPAEDRLFWQTTAMARSFGWMLCIMTMMIKVNIIAIIFILYSDGTYPLQLNGVRDRSSHCRQAFSWRWTLDLLYAVNTWWWNEHWKLGLRLTYGAVIILVVFKVCIQVWWATQNIPNNIIVAAELALSYNRSAIIFTPILSWYWKTFDVGCISSETDKWFIWYSSQWLDWNNNQYNTILY